MMRRERAEAYAGSGRKGDRMKRIRKATKGAGLISVVVAFLMLMMILLLFWQSLRLSGNLLARSVDIRRETQELAGGYYRNKSTPTRTADRICSFHGESGGFTLTTQWSAYVQQEGTIYYFGDGTAGGGSEAEGGVK